MLLVASLPATIERLGRDASADDVRSLALLLMAAVGRAADAGFTVLLLDTCKGYDAVFFYKELPAQS